MWLLTKSVLLGKNTRQLHFPISGSGGGLLKGRSLAHLVKLQSEPLSGATCLSHMNGMSSMSTSKILRLWAERSTPRMLVAILTSWACTILMKLKTFSFPFAFGRVWSNDSLMVVCKISMTSVTCCALTCEHNHLSTAARWPVLDSLIFSRSKSKVSAWAKEIQNRIPLRNLNEPPAWSWIITWSSMKS